MAILPNSIQHIIRNADKMFYYRGQNLAINTKSLKFAKKLVPVYNSNNKVTLTLALLLLVEPERVCVRVQERSAYYYTCKYFNHSLSRLLQYIGLDIITPVTADDLATS